MVVVLLLQIFNCYVLIVTVAKRHILQTIFKTTLKQVNTIVKLHRIKNTL
jgi:hypothetical protein